MQALTSCAPDACVTQHPDEVRCHDRYAYARYPPVCRHHRLPLRLAARRVQRQSLPDRALDPGHIDVHEAGVTAQVYCGRSRTAPQATLQVMRSLDAFYATLDESQDAMRLAQPGRQHQARCRPTGSWPACSVWRAPTLSGEYALEAVLPPGRARDGLDLESPQRSG